MISTTHSPASSPSRQAVSATGRGGDHHHAPVGNPSFSSPPAHTGARCAEPDRGFFLEDDGTAWDPHDYQGRRPEQVAFSAAVCFWAAVGLLLIGTVIAVIAVLGG